MSTFKKNAIFVLAYFLAVVAYLWFDPIASEDVSDLAGFLFPVAGLAGLAWANAHSFATVRHGAARLALRGAVTTALSVVLVALTYVYSWHIRPALGLRCQGNTPAHQQVDSIRH